MKIRREGNKPFSNRKRSSKRLTKIGIKGTKKMQTTIHITDIFKRACMILVIVAVAAAWSMSVSAQSKASNTNIDQKGSQDIEAKSVSANGLEGTWIVTVNPGPGIPLITALHTYSANGAMLESNTTDQQPPIQSPGHGTWKQIGRNLFAFTFVKFQYDSNGNIVSTLKVRSELRLKRNTFTGHSEVFVCDPSFDNCFSVGTSTDLGMRLGVQTYGPALNQKQ